MPNILTYIRDVKMNLFKKMYFMVAWCTIFFWRYVVPCAKVGDIKMRIGWKKQNTSMYTEILFRGFLWASRSLGIKSTVQLAAWPVTLYISIDRRKQKRLETQDIYNFLNNANKKCQLHIFNTKDLLWEQRIICIKIASNYKNILFIVKLT